MDIEEFQNKDHGMQLLLALLYHVGGPGFKPQPPLDGSVHLY